MQQQTTQSTLLASSQRPVPLRRRVDLEIAQIDYKGIPFPVVKDPVGLKYYRLQPEQFELLLALNGELSLEELRDHLLLRFPTLSVTPADVQRLISDLHEKGLLYSERFGQGEKMVERKRKNFWKKTRQVLLNPLYIRLPGWDPERTLQRLEPWFGWMFTKPAATILMLFVASSWLFVLMRFDVIRQRLPEFQQFFGWPNLIYLWATLAVAKILHEFGHGIACKHFGAECHSMGVMLLVFSPTLYCDVTDSWMLKSKWKRIVIGAAGIYVEIILSAMAVYFWYNTQPGLLNHLALNVFFVSTVTTVIFNANPLLRYDGYYMMADFLEIPNLRSKASKLLSQTIGWWGFGIEVPDDPFMPTSGKHWFVLYSIASALYRWFVLFAITIFLYTVLKPYRLQSIGIMLAVGSLASIFIGLGINFYKMLIVPKQDPVSKLKVIVTCSLLAGLVAIIAFVPVPWYQEASFYIEPDEVEHVYTAVPGILVTQHVQPGDQVRKGDHLVTLRSPEMLDQQDRLIVERSAQLTQPPMYQQLSDPDGMRLAEWHLRTIEDQLSDLQLQLQRVAVSAPISGIVVAPSRTPRPDIESMKQRLPTWFGTPTQAHNLGTYLEERTHVCSIAPNDAFRAVILVEQSDRGDLSMGDQVRLQLDLFPSEVYDGIVTEFSDRELEFAPPALSNKYGGSLATVSDAQGREKLTSPVYQAIVEFADQPELLRTGLRGRARFIVAERTIFDWLWRWMCETFHFRL